eukprot:3891491-Amphidinium_carterae.1
MVPDSCASTGLSESHTCTHRRSGLNRPQQHTCDCREALNKQHSKAVYICLSETSDGRMPTSETTAEHPRD